MSRQKQRQQPESLLTIYRRELDDTIKKRQMVWYTKKYTGKMEHIKDFDAKISFLLEKISWEQGKQIYSEVDNEFSGLRRSSSSGVFPRQIDK